MNVPLASVGVAASTPPEVHEKLASYQSALDLPIVRVLAIVRREQGRFERKRAQPARTSTPTAVTLIPPTTSRR